MADRFDRARYGFTDHVKRGRLSFDAWALHGWLRQHCYEGVCHTSAGYLAKQIRKPVRVVQRLLRELDGTYINRLRVNGVMGNYPILIHKYEIGTVTSRKRLNAWKSKSTDALVWEPVTSRGTSSGTGQGTSQGTVIRREHRENKEMNREAGTLPGFEPPAEARRAVARDILKDINRRSGKRFREIDTNLAPIVALLRRADLTEDRIREVIAWKVDDVVREARVKRDDGLLRFAAPTSVCRPKNFYVSEGLAPDRYGQEPERLPENVTPIRQMVTPEPDAIAAWLRIRENIEPAIDPHRFDTWLRPCVGVSIRNGVLRVGAPNPVLAQYAGETFGDSIRAAIIADRALAAIDKVEFEAVIVAGSMNEHV